MANVGEPWLSWKRDAHLSTPWHPAITAFCFGVALHQVIRKFEIDSFQVEVLQVFAGVNGLVVFVLWQSSAVGSLLEDVRLVLWTDAFLLTGLFLRISLYRTYFHRLHKFPGPLGARLTKFWALGQVAKTVQWNEAVRGLHQQFGDFVRIGLFAVCHLVKTFN